MTEVKVGVALVTLIMAGIAAFKKDYEWSRHFTLISIIFSLSV